MTYHRAREPRADKHAQAISDEDNDALRSRAKMQRGFAIDVDLTGDKEEVVADTVQQDAAPQHPHVRIDVAICEQKITGNPRQHAGDQHIFHA